MAGNRATAGLLAGLHREVASTTTSGWHPARYASYGDWLQSLPDGAIDYTAVDVTEKIRRELPELAALVTDLRADCADVGILLRHFYLNGHGKNGYIKSRDPADKTKTIRYTIGKGVSRRQLKRVVGYIGTIHFQRGQSSSKRPLNWYGKKSPFLNLKTILAAGLEPGDILVWKKKRGVRGNFSGHFQTVQRISPYVPLETGHQGAEALGHIAVIQGTMEHGEPKSQIQSKRLTFEMLTGKKDGDGAIIFEPGDSEEYFFGAGKWR